MGEGHKGCRILCCVLWLLLISHACTGSRCTNTAHCNVVQIMDLCSFLNVPFALSLVVKLRIKLLPSFIRRTKTRLLWENEVTAMIFELTFFLGGGEWGGSCILPFVF